MTVEERLYQRDEARRKAEETAPQCRADLWLEDMAFRCCRVDGHDGPHRNTQEHGKRYVSIEWGDIPTELPL